MSAKRSNQNSEVQLEAPRFEDQEALLIAGLRHHYSPDAMNEIPNQWRGFMPHIGNVPGQIGRATYGLTFLSKDSSGIDYLSGVEVSGCKGLPNELSCVEVPAQKYAVFVHPGHVSEIWKTCDAIQNQWFPRSDYQHVRPTPGAPDFFERYTESFDPTTGTGGIEIWVPIKS
jgi:AraC family transcriptional regulator